MSHPLISIDDHRRAVSLRDLTYVSAGGEWVEIGKCGLALPALLEDNHLDPARTSGLAMSLGLDRILMLRKGIDDIRL